MLDTHKHYNDFWGAWYETDQAASTLKYVSLQSNTHNKVDAMVFDFSGTKITIPGSYSIGKVKANNEAGYMCFWNVLPHKSNEPILGAPFFEAIIANFDFDKREIGVANTKDALNDYKTEKNYSS